MHYLGWQGYHTACNTDNNCLYAAKRALDARQVLVRWRKSRSCRSSVVRPLPKGKSSQGRRPQKAPVKTLMLYEMAALFGLVNLTGKVNFSPARISSSLMVM